jgi:hypothetical protein
LQLARPIERAADRIQAKILSLDLDQMSATYLSKAVQILVRPKYAADSNTGTNPEDKISSLASSVSRLSKQVRPLAPNDAFCSAFTTGSLAAAQDVFLSIFQLTIPSLTIRLPNWTRADLDLKKRLIGGRLNRGAPLLATPNQIKLSQCGNDVLIATDVCSQNHSDATHRLWRSITCRNSTNPVL